MRGWRTIVVDGVVWRWRIGRRGGTLSLRDPSGRGVNMDTHVVVGTTPNNFERGQWKRTSDGMVTPADVASFIRRMEGPMNEGHLRSAYNILVEERRVFIQKPREGAELEQLKLVENAISSLEVALLGSADRGGLAGRVKPKTGPGLADRVKARTSRRR